MKVVFERCSGVDLHKKTVVANVVTPEGRETKTFRTTTPRLREFAVWLKSRGVTHVAMESTGSYWKPIWNILEEETDCELWLVNAHHIKQVPGRKTDVKDAEWIAELLQHGLLTPSYVPCREHRELRELTRYRRTLIQNRTRLIQRVQKILEGANIKLDSVISDVMGYSGKTIIRAMISGQTDPAKLAALASSRIQASPDDLREALEGLVGDHQRVLLDSLVRQIDAADNEVTLMDDEVAKRMVMLSPSDIGPGTDQQPISQPLPDDTKSTNVTSWVEAIEMVDAMPGVARRAAEDLLAETGIDMEHFLNADHFTSWAKVCPGNNESGGKRRSGRTGKGNPWIRSILVQMAWAATRKKDCYYADQYRRLSGRRGKKRAIIAVARSMLEAMFWMLRRNQPYRELGKEHLDQVRQDRIAKQAVKRLNRLGYNVTLESKDQAQAS